jgi:glycerophosphoryl diester phosphodiesterase
MATPPVRILRHLPWQALAGASSTLALIVVLLVAPGGVHAATVFDSLRTPGQAGFIAAHRGGVGAPENTLVAMRQALTGPAAFVETDVQLTSDGVPVLMHDWTLDRTTDGTGPVWAHTFAELGRLDAGSWFDSAFEGVRVPSLAEFLALLAPSSKEAIIELKGSWNRQQVQEFAELVSDAGLESRVIVASFSLTTLEYLRDVAVDIPRAIITHQVVGDPAILAAACGAVAIVTSRTFLDRDPGAVGRIHEAGLGVLAYTLNGESTWASALALGVDGFITDQTADLGTWLNAAH